MIKSKFRVPLVLRSSLQNCPTLPPSILSLLLLPYVRLPVRLHVCKEARAEALKTYICSFHNPVFINPAAYTLHIEDTSRY
jgi:hypothetical protein